MKVLMQGKIDLFESGGGDKIQIENTAKELIELGVEVDIKAGFDVDYSNYDLIHLFQLDWTPETYVYSRNVQRTEKPLVLSPIHHSVEELRKFDEEYTYDFRRVAKVLFKSQFKRDTLKNIYKAFFDLRKMYPTVLSVIKGLKNMHTKALEWADMVLVQTELEAQDLKNTYGVDIEWVKIPNGVGQPFIDVLNKTKNNEPVELENLLEFKDYVVCVGRVEARKNQLSVIEAMKHFRRVHDEDIQLVFVGKKSKMKHMEYVYRFDKELKKNPWVHHLEQVPYEKMPAVYNHAKVCVSASWFETTGLTSLEALFCGTNSVAAGERAKEYLGDLVSYCQPEDMESIQKAVSKEYFKEPPVIPDEMAEQYTWENAARRTLEVYNRLLS